jgi:AraC-like DNA-binding protein
VTTGRACRSIDDVANSIAVHFKAAAGMAPLTWLTQWRMHMTKRVLIEEETPIAVLAASLSYASESAFSSAFKRVTGVAPRNYRRAGRKG